MRTRTKHVHIVFFFFTGLHSGNYFLTPACFSVCICCFNSLVGPLVASLGMSKHSCAACDTVGSPDFCIVYFLSCFFFFLFCFCLFSYGWNFGRRAKNEAPMDASCLCAPCRLMLVLCHSYPPLLLHTCTLAYVWTWQHWATHCGFSLAFGLGLAWLSSAPLKGVLLVVAVECLFALVGFCLCWCCGLCKTDRSGCAHSVVLLFVCVRVALYDNSNAH